MGAQRGCWSRTCQGGWPHRRCTIQAIACSTKGSDQHGEGGWQDSGGGGGTVQRRSIDYFPAGVRASGIGAQGVMASECESLVRTGSLSTPKQFAHNLAKGKRARTRLQLVSHVKP